MSNEIIPNSSSPAETASEPTTESFGEMLTQFEHSHSHKVEGGARQLEGIVVSVDAESVYLDIGFKAEGVLLRTAFENNAEGVNPGDKFPVSVKGRNLEGYYELSRLRVTLPTDWSSLEEAFAQKSAVVGIVTGVVKGGLNVDVGVRAFMPASRSGVRDAAEMEKLVGQEITCRITKLDVTDEDVVVDRRAILEEQALSVRQRSILRSQGRRHRQRRSSQPRGLWCFCRYRRYRWPAPCQRHFVEPREFAGRCADRGAATAA